MLSASTPFWAFTGMRFVAMSVSYVTMNIVDCFGINLRRWLGIDARLVKHLKNLFCKNRISKKI